MSSKGGRRNLKHRPGRQRPSLFFVLALGAGLVLFVWILVQVATNRAKEEKPLGAAAVSATLRAS